MEITLYRVPSYRDNMNTAIIKPLEVKGAECVGMCDVCLTIYQKDEEIKKITDGGICFCSDMMCAGVTKDIFWKIRRNFVNL